MISSDPGSGAQGNQSMVNTQRMQLDKKKAAMAQQEKKKGCC